MAQRRASTVGHLVWHLSNKWRVAVDRALGPLGLTHPQYALMASLYALSRRGTRPSQRELADFSGLEPMYVSKLARALERSGLLRRAEHPEDPRAFQLELTAGGASLVVDAAAIVRRLYDHLLRPIGGPAGKRAAVLTRMLERLVDRAEALDRPGASRDVA